MRYPDRRSKIVCTLGPKVANYESICRLIECGMDVARLNFSHGTHAAHLEVIGWIRKASKELHTPIAILGDLQGPKIRTGKLLPNQSQSPGWKDIQAGQSLYFRGVDVAAEAQPGDGTKQKPITISYPRLALDLKATDVVLFDDGLIRMIVESCLPDENLIVLKVEFGQKLGENKGVNMPASRLSTLGVTEKDWDDILFATENNVDFLALSFVRTAREVKSLKQFIDKKRLGTQIISKIEKAEAIENIDEIIHWSDAIMVARGDLGVEIGNEKVPVVQKMLIKKARIAGKPVITATQMLMSMVSSPSPSRAEASDVANAVFDGTDALMLSNETATGDYPFESVQMMASIIRDAETVPTRDPGVKGLQDYIKAGQKLPVSEAIEAAATTLAAALGASCLACLTRSGQAARQLAKYRPPVPIFAFAENAKVRTQLSLCWGVTVIPWSEMHSMDHTVFDQMAAELGRMGLLKDSQFSVMTAGIPTSKQVGTTNTVVVKKYSPFAATEEST